MSSIKLFCTVGTTPIAVANSLTSHLLHLTDANSIDIYFIVSEDNKALFTKGSFSELSSILKKYHNNLKHFPSLQASDIIFHSSEDETIRITEHLLLENTTRIVRAVDAIIDQNDRVIFDITAGRKVMVSSSLLACSLLHRIKPVRSYELAYYWLKEFTTENLSKYLYELGFDSYQSVFTPLDDIESCVRDLTGDLA